MLDRRSGPWALCSLGANQIERPAGTLPAHIRAAWVIETAAARRTICSAFADRIHHQAIVFEAEATARTRGRHLARMMHDLKHHPPTG